MRGAAVHLLSRPKSCIMGKQVNGGAGPRKGARLEIRRGVGYLCLVAALLALLGARVAARETPLSLPETPAETEAASRGLDEITAALAFDPLSQAQLTGTQTFLLTNRTGQRQQAVVLRNYTGAYGAEETSPAASEELFASCYGDAFSPGGLTVDAVLVGGEETDILWQDAARTVLVLPLAQAWEPGEQVRVEIAWRAVIPKCASRFGESGGIWALGNVMLTPAVWENGAYHMEPYIAVGDPFASACANWRVTLDLPRGWTAAASVWSSAESTADGARYTWRALAMRDFTLVLSKEWKQAAQQCGGTLLCCYAKSLQDARAMLGEAEKTLQTLEALYGPYAYPSLTLCEVDFPYGGMEYPGLAMIGSDMLRMGAETLETTVAHEVAHQWWGIQVGSDGWNNAWQDETLAVWGQLACLKARHGEALRQATMALHAKESAEMAETAGATPGSALDAFADLSVYSTLVYSRGTSLWAGLETLLGEERLHAALRDYAERFRFQRATRQDLENLLSEWADMDVGPLMRYYLDTSWDGWSGYVPEEAKGM